MCSPELLKIGAGGVAAASGITQGRNLRSAADSNAAQMLRQAQEVAEAGSLEATRIRREGRALAGKQRAALAAQGVDPNTGTSLAIVEDTYAVSEEDAMMVRNNAARHAFGLRTQAGIDKKLGKQSQFGATLAGFTTALTHGAEAYSYRKRK